jgi:transposase
MMRRISRDVKVAAIRLFERDLLGIDEILDCCGFSARTFYRILKLWRETGDVVKHSPSRHGRPRILVREDIDYLLGLIRHNPTYFLHELLYLLQQNQFVSIHYTTIHRELERLNVSKKKLRRIAIERDELGRAAFIARMARYSPEELGFIDEMSTDRRAIGRRYGRSPSGMRASQRQPFIRGRRTTTEALLSLDGIIAATVVEGSMTKARFLEWLEFTVVCGLISGSFRDLTKQSSCRSVLPTLALSVCL